MNSSEMQRFKIELAGTAEAMGKDLSDIGLKIFAQDLSEYQFADAVEAIQDCRRSLNRFPTINDIISKIQSKDGRPGAEEAWAMIPKDDSGSVVWTDEMAGAYGIAHPLILSGDEIAARMAFKEKYTSLLKEVREKKVPARWTLSAGTNPAEVQDTVQKALSLGRLSPQTAKALGHDSNPEVLSLPSPDLLDVDPSEVKQNVMALIARITKTVPVENEENKN